MGLRGRHPSPERLALEVYECSHCLAEPGQPCTTPAGIIGRQGSKFVHASRQHQFDADEMEDLRRGNRK